MARTLYQSLDPMARANLNKDFSLGITANQKTSKIFNDQDVRRYDTSYKEHHEKHERNPPSSFKEATLRGKMVLQNPLNNPVKDKQFKNTSNLYYIFEKEAQGDLNDSRNSKNWRKSSLNCAKENTRQSILTNQLQEPKYNLAKTDVTKSFHPGLCYR